MADSWIHATAGTETARKTPTAQMRQTPACTPATNVPSASRINRREAGRVVIDDAAHLGQEHQPHRRHEGQPVQRLGRHELHALRARVELAASPK